MAKRVISAFVGIAIALGVLFLAETPVLPLIVAALIDIALYELLNVCGCLKFRMHSAGCFIYGTLTPFLCYYTTDLKWRLMLSSVVILGMLAGYVGDHKKLPFDRLACMITCSLLVTLSMSGLVSLYKMSDLHGICYIVIALASAWLGDAGAFFVGTAFGKHKLCPDISPKKTVEGAVGGVVTTMLVLCIYCLCYQKFMETQGHVFSVNYIAIAVYGMAASVLGMIGDLTASLLKREHEIKDYGNIMPGHGGVMDRFDSVLFIVPFMLMFVTFINFFN